MIISYEAELSDLPDIMRKLFTIVPWNKWRNRVADLQNEGRNIPQWNEFLENNHGIEITLFNFWDKYRVRGVISKQQKTPNEYKAFSFAAMATRIYGQLPPKAKIKFAGHISWLLEDPCGLDPLYCELFTAMQFMSQGIDVEFNDLTHDGFDFLCRKENEHFEVECKRFSSDKGKKVHERDFRHLLAKIQPILDGNRSDENFGHHISITIKERLSRNDIQQTAITKSIQECLLTKKSIQNNVCSVQLKSFSIKESIFSKKHKPLNIEDDIRIQFDDNTTPNVSQIYCNWKPEKNATVLTLKCEQNEDVTDYMYNEMKKHAKNQFSKTRPAVLVVHLGGISNNDLKLIAQTGSPETPTGLLRIANEVLFKREHLYNVAFISRAENHYEEYVQNGRLVRSNRQRANAYLFDNPKHPDILTKRIKGVFGIS